MDIFLAVEQSHLDEQSKELAKHYYAGRTSYHEIVEVMEISERTFYRKKKQIRSVVINANEKQLPNNY